LYVSDKNLGVSPSYPKTNPQEEAMNKVTVENFYVDTKYFDEVELQLNRLLSEGYEPLMQLGISEDYSVWAFVKREAPTGEENADDRH
jgi:hypothetical protein